MALRVFAVIFCVARSEAVGRIGPVKVATSQWTTVAPVN
jgi:hypothetical protein